MKEISTAPASRESNIELLRIIAMILVMMVHANFFLLNPPSLNNITTSPFSSFVRFYTEALSFVCVNVFIIISGWFGVKARLHRLVELLFQVFFIAVFIEFVMCALGLAKPTSIIGWMRLIVFKDAWFIRSYIILYLFTPALNAYVKTASKKQFIMMLLGFYFFQTLYGGFISSPDSYDSFCGGYSPLSFMGLYLIGMYLRKYPIKLSSLNKYHDLMIYFISSLITASMSIALVVIGKDDYIWKFYSYSSPFVIIASVHFFLFFTKISIRSRAINWISISCFAAFLVHGNGHVFSLLFENLIKQWFNSTSTLVFVLYTGSLIVIVFMISILIDKLRIFVWRNTLRRFFTEEMLF